MTQQHSLSTRPRRRRVSLKEDPDQPHAFQPRKVTYRGKKIMHIDDYGKPGWWQACTVSGDEAIPPCRHCGGSESLPIHWMDR